VIVVLAVAGSEAEAEMMFVPRGLLAELAGLTVWRLWNILDPEERWGYPRGG
jgi:hypothetical protein